MCKFSFLIIIRFIFVLKFWYNYLNFVILNFVFMKLFITYVWLMYYYKVFQTYFYSKRKKKILNVINSIYLHFSYHLSFTPNTLSIFHYRWINYTRWNRNCRMRTINDASILVSVEVGWKIVPNADIRESSKGYIWADWTWKLSGRWWIPCRVPFLILFCSFRFKAHIDPTHTLQSCMTP